MVSSVPGKIKRPEVELAPPPVEPTAVKDLYHYPPMQHPAALKVMCWNVKYNPKIPTQPKKSAAFNAYVHQHRPDAVFVQEAPDLFLEGYAKLQDDTVGAATVFLKDGRFSIRSARTVESVSNDRRFPVRPTLLVEVEDEVTRKPIVLGSAWVGHHITQANWDKYAQDLGLPPGVDVIVGGDFNDAVHLQKGAVTLAEMGRLETPGNTCCEDNMAFKGDVFFTNMSGRADNLPYKKDVSDHSPILGHFETTSGELTDYFALAADHGYREPHAALEHLLPVLPAYVENDFRRAAPGLFKAFEFNPHLNQERVDAFCRKWGSDLRHKLVVAYHGTGKYVTNLILKSNLRKGSINAYGVGAYLATQLYTPMYYVTKIVRGEVNELLGCLVVVNRDTVHDLKSVDPKTGFETARPDNYVVVKPGQHPDESLDAILPLFVIKFVEPQLRKVVDPRVPIEKIDGIPFALPPAAQEAILFGGIKARTRLRPKARTRLRPKARARRKSRRSH